MTSDKQAHKTGTSLKEQEILNVQRATEAVNYGKKAKTELPVKIEAGNR
jgi:hypothetical protein